MVGRTVRHRKSESGQALILICVMIIVLLGLVGFAVDVGYLRQAQMRLQIAADSAAIAGAAEVLFSDVTTAARGAAAANGFTSGANGVAVTVNNGPSTGPHSGDKNYVEAIISQNQPTFFMRALGFTSVPLTARSVALGNSNCVFALSGGTGLTLTLAAVTSSCGVVGNGDLTGFLGSLTAPSIGLVGNSGGFFVSTTPTPTKITHFADPLASLVAPTSPTTCPTLNTLTYNNGTHTVTGHSGLVSVRGGNVTFNAGTYYGGISVTGGVVTFNPGTYVLYGGGLGISGFSTVNGSGVTFYNTGKTSGACQYDSITTNFTNGSLSAPTTGTYSSILFFQDRNNSSDATFNGSPGSLTGAYYFPDAGVTFSFNFGTSPDYTILVANTIQWTASFNFNDDYSKLSGGSAIANTGTLVE